MESKENVVCAILLAIVYTCSLASANYGAQQKPISVVLKGRVVCDACSLDHKKIPDTNDIISGAVVYVECNSGLNRKTSPGLVSIEGETNENGEFKVELPSSIISSILLSSSADHSSTVKGYCSVRLLSSPQEKCNVSFPAIASSSDLLTLTSECHGIRTFTFPSLSYALQSKMCSDRDIAGSSDHGSLRTGRVLMHEISKGLSNGMDALFPNAIFPPLPKPDLGFPPLHLPHPHLPHPHLGFPPPHLPHPHNRPVLSFPPIPASLSPLPDLSPLPASIPYYPGPTVFP